MELGKRITEIRKQNNMTQEDLAEKFHVTRQTISNWENGKSYPDIETLICISNEFNVSLDLMLKGDKDMVKEITKEQQQGKQQKKRIILAVIIAIIVILGAVFILNNTSTELSPEDYTITVKEITLDNVTVDEVNKIATYKDIEGGEYIKEDETKEEGGMYESAIGVGVYVFKGEEYAGLMTYGKAYEIVITSDNAIDTLYVSSHDESEALEVNIGRSNSNLFKPKEPGRAMTIWFEDFDKIYDDNTIVWEK